MKRLVTTLVLIPGIIVVLSGCGSTGPSPEQQTREAQQQQDAERQQAVEATFEFLQRHRPLANVGSLARVRLGSGNNRSVLPMSRMKPLLVVRTPNEFLRIAAFWIAED